MDTLGPTKSILTYQGILIFKVSIMTTLRYVNKTTSGNAKWPFEPSVCQPQLQARVPGFL